MDVTAYFGTIGMNVQQPQPKELHVQQAQAQPQQPQLRQPQLRQPQQLRRKVRNSRLHFDSIEFLFNE